MLALGIPARRVRPTLNKGCIARAKAQSYSEHPNLLIFFEIKMAGKFAPVGCRRLHCQPDGRLASSLAREKDLTHMKTAAMFVAKSAWFGARSKKNSASHD
jgi:hypothetical protein